MAKEGRPTKMTPDVVMKLEQAFAIDASVEEACSYAEISRNTFYEYLKKNPNFQDRIDDLRQRPVLKARQTVTKALDDPNHAFKYLEKKRRKEFGQNIDITSDNKPIPILSLDVLRNDSNKENSQSFKENTSSTGRDECEQDD